MPDRPAPPSLPASPEKEPLGARLSVWSTGQRDRAAQLRDSGCAPGTDSDTDQIPPAIAAHTIATYTRPGELVLDPDCGTGTVLTEALRADRYTVGLTTRSRWWTTARANITAAKAAGAHRDGTVLDAPPRLLASVHAAGLIGQVGLILTALRTATGTDPSDPDDGAPAAIRALAETLNYCEPLLRSGGHVVIVARPRRHPGGSLVDLTTSLIAAGAAAGLAPVERCVALTAELRGSRLVTRASFAERRAAATAQAGGAPVMLLAHHEVVVLQPVHDVQLAAAAALGAPRPASAGCASRVVPDRSGAVRDRCGLPTGGGVVGDRFSGDGTTGLAAIRRQRLLDDVEGTAA